MNRGELPKTGEIFQGLAYVGVLQDKAPQVRDTTASGQPYTADENAVDTPKQHGSEKRQTAHVSARIPFHVKTGLLQIRQRNGWSESKAVAEACKTYLEQDLGERFGLRLAAIVTDAIEQCLQKLSNRLAYLSLHGYYASEENRIISTKVYRYLFGTDTEIYKQTVEQSRTEAYTNVRRPIEEKSPTRF